MYIENSFRNLTSPCTNWKFKQMIAKMSFRLIIKIQLQQNINMEWSYVGDGNKE